MKQKKLIIFLPLIKEEVERKLKYLKNEKN